MKKLAYVITQSEMGGAQKNIILLCKKLKESYDITVYSAAGGGLIDELFRIGIQHISIPDMVREINLMKDYKAYRFLVKEFKANKYDIVHSHSSKAGIVARQAAKTAGIKNVIFTAHGFVFNEPMSSLKKKIYTFLEKYEGKNSDWIICVDPTDIKTAEKNSIKARKGLVYVPNGIEFTEQDASSVKIINKDPRTPFIFGLVANFYETKGHRYLIEAFNKLTIEANINAKLVLIGEGTLKEEMEGLAGNNKDIEFTGYRKDAVELMKNFDCFVMSSVKEGFPFVILEAIKNKLPIISTDVGAVREILDNGRLGIVVNTRDIEELANAMKQVYNHREDAETKALKAFEECSSKYSIDTMVNLTKKIYDID
jgi:glycosyltransferase involved in cell wall biosynthesis